jgi:hypothetical protein
MRRFVFAFLVASFTAAAARADDVGDARAAFDEGVELVKNQRWGDALASFERAARLKPHALAYYNMGIAERSLGHLTRARVQFHTALERDERSGHKELPASFADETQGNLKDIEARLVHLQVKLEPADSSLTIDGRPLAIDPTKRTTAMHAGVALASAEPPVLATTFEIVMDPGQREFVLQKEGFTPAIARESYVPGARADLHLSLSALAATIHVDADRRDAAVRIQGLDVGVVPVDVRRPPGTYALDVRSPGFVTYETKVQVGPGGHASLFAKMPPEPFVLTKKWWFWTGIVALVGGAALTVFLVTRPPADYDSGNTGWLVEAK